MLHQQITIVTLIVPKDITGAAQTSPWLSLKNYRNCDIYITQAAWAGGTPAVTVTQAKDLSGTAPKPLPFTKRYQQATNVGTGYTESDVTNNTFTLPNTANQTHIISINAATLDVDNGYDCIQLTIASPGTNADLLQAIALLSGARYADTVMPNALVA